MFDGVPAQDIVTWNSMVDGIVSNEGADWYALVGHARVGIIDALTTGCLVPQCKGGRFTPM
jgi:hypothetical protein